MHIDIVIPNYNGRKFLGACLDSLQGQSFSDFTVFVVDNGSTDESVSFLADKYPHVKRIAFSENRGFSAAVNAGIDAGSAPLVFLLNNDTELDTKCLEELSSAAEKMEEYDFFAMKMINYHDRTRLDGAGDGFLRGGVGYKLGTMEKDGEAYSVAREVFGTCAGAALYRRTFFKGIGLFDEDFFAYLEDVDLNLRAKSRGRRCWYIPEARVYHIGSATTGSRINAFTVSLSTRNNLNVLLKNYPLPLLFRFFPALCVYQFFWFLFVLKKLQLPAYLQGLWKFLRNIPIMLEKRRRNLAAASISQKELAALMSHAEKDAVRSIMRRREEQGKGNGLFTLYLRLFL